MTITCEARHKAPAIKHYTWLHLTGLSWASFWRPKSVVPRITLSLGMMLTNAIEWVWLRDTRMRSLALPRDLACSAAISIQLWDKKLSKGLGMRPKITLTERQYLLRIYVGCGLVSSPARPSLFRAIDMPNKATTRLHSSRLEIPGMLMWESDSHDQL